MTEWDCEQFRAESAELALGILDGRDRADALAHLDHCPACRHELLLLGDLADRLVELTPAAEPAAGFETRVLASISPPRPARRRHRPAVLAAAAVAAVLAIGGWVVGHRAVPAHPSIAGNQIVTADLVSGTHHVGQVIATAGAHPWISMAVDTGLGDQTVVCQLREGGAIVPVGSFVLSHGYGYWGAPIPPAFPLAAASRVTGAQLIDAEGRTVARASFTLRGTSR